MEVKVVSKSVMFFEPFWRSRMVNVYWSLVWVVFDGSSVHASFAAIHIACHDLSAYVLILFFWSVYSTLFVSSGVLLGVYRYFSGHVWPLLPFNVTFVPFAVCLNTFIRMMIDKLTSASLCQISPLNTPSHFIVDQLAVNWRAEQHNFENVLLYKHVHYRTCFGDRSAWSALLRTCCSNWLNSIEFTVLYWQI